MKSWKIEELCQAHQSMMQKQYQKNSARQMILRQYPEDFQVIEDIGELQEQSGEHLWIEIEKKQLSTVHVQKHFAAQTGCPARDIGFSGRKDFFAQTRQWLSVPKRYLSEGLSSLENEKIQVLQSCERQKKLHLGRHHGNKFMIRLRQPLNTEDHAVEKELHNMSENGGQEVANFFGQQRYGHDYQTVFEAYEFACKQRKAKKPFEKFWISALQSLFFDMWLSSHIEKRGLCHLSVGDHMVVRVGGRARVAEESDLHVEQTIVAGPMLGAEHQHIKSESMTILSECLGEYQIDMSECMLHPAFEGGTWRAAYYQARDFSCRAEDGDIITEFYLSSGCYATSFLDAITDFHIVHAKSQAES